MPFAAPSRIAFFAAALAAGLASTCEADTVMHQLAPSGKLRVAIAVGPTLSAIYATKNPDGGYRGVTIALSHALAKKLGVALEFVPYLASGEIQASAASGVWDVSFMPVDAERKKFVDFGNAYHLLQSTYLVPSGAPIKSVADANKPGVRIAGVKDTATFRASNRASPLATHMALAGPDDCIEKMRKGEADAIALGRESLTGVQAKLVGSRILDDAFLNSTTAIAVPKGKPEALAYVSAFIEEAKASGLVRKAFDDIGLKTSQVAPAGMKP